MTDLIDAAEDFPPAEAWAEFLSMRKKLKRPMTEYAQKLMIKKLRAYVANGQDAQAMLDQSILKGWTDVYEVKTDEPQRGAAPGFRGATRLALVDQNAANNAEAMRLLDEANFDSLRTIDECR